MQDPQPQLPYGDPESLEEIRRLLAAQNDLLLEISNLLRDRLLPPVWTADSSDDPFAEDEEDDAFWDEVYGTTDDEEDLPEPPRWFARHYPFES